MEYVNPKTGERAPIPWGKSAAAAAGYSRYMDERGCTKCGNASVGRYFERDACVVCSMKEAAEIWALWVMGSPDRPANFATSRAQALELGVDHYYRETLCKGGPHFVQPHVKSGKCVACSKTTPVEQSASDIMQGNPGLILGREDAALLGMPVYRTGEPCRRGHIDFRYVSNGGCLSCMRGVVTAPAIAQIDANRRMTVAEQAQLFIGYAWDGRRMLDPDGRKLTVAQFNIAIGGAGRYELSGGRPDVFTSHAAFIGNFGPGRPRQ
jgi:hypothetical protein